MKALENLTRDAFPLACLGSCVILVRSGHPVWAGLLLYCAFMAWLLVRVGARKGNPNGK